MSKKLKLGILAVLLIVLFSILTCYYIDYVCGAWQKEEFARVTECIAPSSPDAEGVMVVISETGTYKAKATPDMWSKCKKDKIVITVRNTGYFTDIVYDARITNPNGEGEMLKKFLLSLTDSKSGTKMQNHPK